MSVKAMAARLGYSDWSIALSKYAHVLPSEETAAVERLGALLGMEPGEGHARARYAVRELR